MNKEYARLVNGTPEYAPATLHGATGLIVNPSRMTYLAHGWKFLDLQTPADPPSGMEYALTGYAETATDIRAEWKLVAIAAPTRTFSKLKLVVALASRGKWDAVRDWLDEGEYGDLFDAAQSLREDDPAFAAALSAAQSRFGFSSEDAAALLAECVAD